MFNSALTTTSAVLIASLLGSPHCVGMCGGFAAYCAGIDQKKAVFLSSFYNFGRLFSYLLLGAAAASLGRAINAGGRIVGLSEVAGWLVGVFLVLWGTARMFSFVSSPYSREPRRSGFFLTKWIKGGYGFLLSKSSLPPALRAFSIGAFSVLLPCFWLYTFTSVAGSTGNIFDGIAIMGIFWVGTIPALGLTGAVTSLGLKGLNRYYPHLSSLLLVAAGVFTIIKRL
ncbi:MAG: sulfite exporter TauE/SafE family protein [Candidatus Dadabacteria bacterium]|nr:MAG: sulfite exporter TauE/SafE family protein [Candidatus Dadabacteria bacterium]